jgi:hypothetical protein
MPVNLRFKIRHGAGMSPRARYAVMRLRARLLPWHRTGPARKHPESLTAELTPRDEDWLAGLERQLWPRHDRPGRLGTGYTLRHPRKDDQQ